MTSNIWISIFLLVWMADVFIATNNTKWDNYDWMIMVCYFIIGFLVWHIAERTYPKWKPKIHITKGDDE